MMHRQGAAGKGRNGGSCSGSCTLPSGRTLKTTWHQRSSQANQATHISGHPDRSLSRLLVLAERSLYDGKVVCRSLGVAGVMEFSEASTAAPIKRFQTLRNPACVKRQAVILQPQILAGGRLRCSPPHLPSSPPAVVWPSSRSALL